MIATRREPKQIEPNEVVQLRFNDAPVAPLDSALYQKVATVPATVVCAMFLKTYGNRNNNMNVNHR